MGRVSGPRAGGVPCKKDYTEEEKRESKERRAKEWATFDIHTVMVVDEALDERRPFNFKIHAIHAVAIQQPIM